MSRPDLDPAPPHSLCASWGAFYWHGHHLVPTPPSAAAEPPDKDTGCLVHSWHGAGLSHHAPAWRVYGRLTVSLLDSEVAWTSTECLQKAEVQEAATPSDSGMKKMVRHPLSSDWPQPKPWFPIWKRKLAGIHKSIGCWSLKVSAIKNMRSGWMLSNLRLQWQVWM